MVQFTSRADSGMTTLPTEQAATDRRAGSPMRDRVRNALVIVLGEFCGTFMFLLLAFIGAQTALVTNSFTDPTAPLLPFSLMYIAASFGTALAVNVWIFYRVSGGMFNPAVSNNHTSLFRSTHMLILSPSSGDSWFGPRRCCATSPCTYYRPYTACCCHSRCRHYRRSHSRPASRHQLSWQRDECCSGCLHRDVPHCPACLNCLLPRCREAP